IGIWQFRDSETNLLEYHLFERFVDRKKVVLQKLEDWTRAIGKLTGTLNVSICERKLPSPLAERPMGSFLWPIGKLSVSPKPNQAEAPSPMERRMSNTFRKPYLDNDYLVRPNEVVETTTASQEDLMSEQA
ncbi:MAG TPA: hypothetical protein VEL47_01290, partial [Myxococcota bacterium]|nr:hypothetical protein [Myxococcota bacterium]